MKCPDCRGTGQITLFTSTGPCKTCGGSGKSEEPNGGFTGGWASMQGTTDSIDTGVLVAATSIATTVASAAPTITASPIIPDCPKCRSSTYTARYAGNPNWCCGKCGWAWPDPQPSQTAP